MRVRRRYLPPGWYPGAEEKAREAIENMERSIKPEPARELQASSRTRDGSSRADWRSRFFRAFRVPWIPS